MPHGSFEQVMLLKQNNGGGLFKLVYFDTVLNHTVRLAVHMCYTISARLKLRFMTSKSAYPYSSWLYAREHYTEEYSGLL